MSLFHNLGKYFILMGKVFAKPEKKKIYYRRVIEEIQLLGIGSIGIVAVISAFIGGVITIQTALNTNNPLIPHYIISLTVRDSIILEFSSSVIALILAGKVGSSISSEIGTMRITEQIDALEIMGVNSASYLILPKIIATMVFNPILTLMSMSIGIFGGWVVGILSGVITHEEYIEGIQYGLEPYYISYSVVKSIVFAFIISSVSSFMGYYVEGGSLEVGKNSTKAVVYCCVLILLFNLILTQLLLS
jgi:phospholipid/cholesterol/gamma-HCH transport system permease protein